MVDDCGASLLDNFSVTFAYILIICKSLFIFFDFSSFLSVCYVIFRFYVYIWILKVMFMCGCISDVFLSMIAYLSMIYHQELFSLYHFLCHSRK